MLELKYEDINTQEKLNQAIDNDICFTIIEEESDDRCVQSIIQK